MTNPPFSIEVRTRKYAVRSVRLYQTMIREGNSGAGSVLGRQFLRAATSIGANVVEAQSGESRADFIHKYSIAQKEANESLYWLRLIADTDLIPSHRLESLINETSELIAIITTIILKSKHNHPRRLNAR